MNDTRDNNKTILRELMEQYALTQADLVAALGVPSFTVYRWLTPSEYGHRPANAVVAFVRAFGMLSPDDRREHMLWAQQTFSAPKAKKTGA